ncbi:cornifelin homolog A [Hydra vulgaris]|uniref:cornifelin homolog A n=1 Tax=Hydra vulgaris TaxID=6087 RepID=UPI001F5E3F1B|nr:cornifelin homolog A-like [Hydra vulgaris]
MTGFKHSICSCCNDIGLTLIACCAPSIIAGKNAEHVGDNCLIYGCIAGTVLGVYLRAMTREKIRKKYLIQGSLCKDILCHMFCCHCSLIQEALLIRSYEKVNASVELTSMNIIRS